MPKNYMTGNNFTGKVKDGKVIIRSKYKFTFSISPKTVYEGTRFVFCSIPFKYEIDIAEYKKLCRYFGNENTVAKRLCSTHYERTIRNCVQEKFPNHLWLANAVGYAEQQIEIDRQMYLLKNLCNTSEEKNTLAKKQETK